MMIQKKKKKKKKKSLSLIYPFFPSTTQSLLKSNRWKSGLYIDYVRLVDLDDPVRSKDRISSRTEDTGFNVDEPVNDEGAEYYASSNSWLGNALGVHLNISNNNRGPSRLPGGARSRAFR